MIQWFMEYAWSGFLTLFWSSWKVMVVILFVAACITFPWWKPFYDLLPRWAKFLLGGFIWTALSALYFYDRGRKAELAKQRQREARAEETRKVIDKEVEKLPDDALKKEVDSWNRDAPPQPAASSSSPASSSRGATRRAAAGKPSVRRTKTS